MTKESGGGLLGFLRFFYPFESEFSGLRARISTPFSICYTPEKPIQGRWIECCGPPATVTIFSK
jgi:hypothetical protein